MKEQLEKLVLQMYRSGIQYLREQRANQVRAAQKLGMHRNTLRRIIRNFELDIRPLRPSTRRAAPGLNLPTPHELEIN